MLRRNPCSVCKRITEDVHSSRATSELGSKGHFSVSSSSSRPEEGSRYPLGSLDTRVRNLHEHLRGCIGSAEGLRRDTGEGGRDGQTDIKKKKKRPIRNKRVIEKGAYKGVQGPPSDAWNLDLINSAGGGGKLFRGDKQGC